MITEGYCPEFNRLSDKELFFRRLLKKYITIIVEAESIDYLPALSDYFEGESFVEYLRRHYNLEIEEWQELEKIAREIE